MEPVTGAATAPATTATRDEASSFTEDTPLIELFAPAAESSKPLSVYDDDGHLVGHIDREALLGAMAQEPFVDSGAQPENGVAGAQPDAPATEGAAR
jgi:glycine betaine/proline transport system ATP-binding protein